MSIGMKKIKGLVIKSQERSVPLQKLTLEDFNLLIPKDTFGIPEYFAIKRGAIKMWPLSKTPYSIEVVYE